MGTSLDALASYFKPIAEELLAKCSEAGIPCRVVDTDRTALEQRVKLAQGVSWTPHSKHLPQPPEEKSEAIDIVPISILAEDKRDWDPTSPVWFQIGKIGEELGLTWGGTWEHVNHGNGDPSHFEWRKPLSQSA
jgi:hypothetical protein